MAEARRVAIDPAAPSQRILERAARLLREGEVVGAPSDTVYGFLAHPGRERARATLSRLKGRRGPFLLLVSSWDQLRARTRNVPASTWERLRRVWPGPVTVILPAGADTPGDVGDTLGVRMPDSRLLCSLIDAVGGPLLSTSANRAGEPPLLHAEEVEAEFPELPLVLDGGPSGSPEPSTVVDLTRSPPRVVRQGRGRAEALLDPSSGPS